MDLLAVAFNDLILNIAVFMGHTANNLKKKRVELLQEPVFEELARYANVDDPLLYLHDGAVPKPSIEVRRRNGELNLC